MKRRHTVALSLTTDDVDNGEDDDPDDVDKVPVHGENIDVVGNVRGVPCRIKQRAKQLEGR